jgi:hypothetical protein
MNRGGFSWRRFLGISAFKGRISRTTGIPLTKSGRDRKVGAALGPLAPLGMILMAGIRLLCPARRQ